MKRFLLVINLSLLFLALVASFIVGLFLINSFRVKDAGAATNDKIPPLIYNSKIFDITASSAAITWQTDEQSDSLVNYGLNRNYGMVRDPFFDKTDHRIVLDDLLSDTTYYFRMISTDKDGNQAISSDFTFSTPGKKEQSEKPGQYPGQSDKPGQYPGQSEQPGQYPGSTEQPGQGQPQTTSETVTQILQTINQITDQKTLEIIQQQIQQQAQQQTEKLEIIFDKVDVETGTDYATIRWKTSSESNSLVSLVTEKDFDANALNPYVWQEGNFDDNVIDHVITVNGLTPATTYHFQVSSKTTLGLEAQSTDKTFVTKSVAPEIYNITIAKIEEDAVTITFATNIPCSSFIEYTNMDTNETKMEGSSNYSVVHSVRVENLKYDTYYSAIITAESEVGEKVQSAPFTFLTIKDEAPPAISKINTESTLYPGSDNKVQTIVSWETDEMATCQFFFHQGFNAPEKVDVLPMEKDLTQKHVQVTTNLLPSTVYKFWIECLDKVSNKARSSDFIMLTPSRDQNIFDIILKNFETTFGWVQGKK
jgi:hypothetical protein